LTMNPNPPKPIISYQCSPKPITISITNPSAGIMYEWDYGYPYFIASGLIYLHDPLQPSDKLFSFYAENAGVYAAVATDTITGCTTKSDSLLFNAEPLDSFKASIYAPHLQLCTGDTTTLVASGYGSALNIKFQWLRNGSLIAGDTAGNLVVSTAGNYQVILDGGPCKLDTSAIAIVSIISPPTASISASSLSICAGDTSVLQTNTGTGFSYTWQQNGSTIPNAFSSVYKATSAGVYNVIISNGACVAIASPITLTVNPAPVVNISPSGIQTICTGTSLALSTSSNAGWTYSWLRNGLSISGATNNTYTTSSAGIYQVKVSTAICPSILSNSVIVKVLVTSLDLGADTTFCNDSVFLPLSVDSNFSQILWSTGAATPNIIATKAGTYWVRAINQCGTFSDTMRIHDAAEFLLNFPDDTLICNSSSSARFSVSAFLQNILWSTGATSSSISIDTPGIYWVEGESPCGMVRDTMKVRFCAPVISKIAPSKDSICEGDCLEISAKLVNFPKTFNWTFAGGNPGSSTLIDPGIVCYSTAGIYPIRLIIRNNGGADTAESFVVVSTKPDPRFKDTIITVPYKSLLELPACATAQITDWYLNDSLVCANCPSLKLEPKNYQSVYRCVLRNGDCTDSCSYALTVVDIPNDLWLPNAFTPNGDSRNDVFHVITDNPNIRIIGLIIYNRWGQQVFVSNQNTQGWNGKLHNQDAEAGTYFWQLQYKVLGNKDKLYFKKGDVLLVR
ncbi:MAG: gliding motility-associated C-terminal domain-containing protein, partial [Chitinophagaceae bacterium]